jgi:hypothetical protein
MGTAETGVTKTWRTRLCRTSTTIVVDAGTKAAITASYGGLAEATCGRRRAVLIGRVLILMGLAIDTPLSVRTTSVTTLAVTTIVVHVLGIEGTVLVWMLVGESAGRTLLLLLVRSAALGRRLLRSGTSRVGSIMTAVVSISGSVSTVSRLLSSALGVLAEIVAVLRRVISTEWSLVRVGTFIVTLGALLLVIALTIIAVVTASAMLVGSVV